MAVQIQGNGGVVADVDGTAFRGFRVTLRPTDHGTLGHYRVSASVLLVATQAANGTLFSVRWGDATRNMVLQRIQLKHIQTVAHTAALNDIRYQVFAARSFTVADSNGTPVVLTGSNQKDRTSHGTSQISVSGDMRFATVAAGLTVGTRTLDALPFLQLQTSYLAAMPTATAAVVQVEQLLMADNAEHPLVFAQNEGIVVRGPTTVFGAAGTATLTVELAWAEVPAY